MLPLVMLILVWVAALVFALTNGLHDAGAVVATLIASRAASPRITVTLSAMASLAGAILGGQAVSRAITGLIRIPASDSRLLPILLAAVLGALTWNFLTWRLGLPSSSTHALTGGCVGAGLAFAGPDSIHWLGGLKAADPSLTRSVAGVFIALILSPLIGFVVAFFLEKASKHLLASAHYSLNHWLNRAQMPLMLLLSFGHGSNDAQKISGILALAGLASSVSLTISDTWQLAAVGLAIFFGTLFGSWPIIRTLSRGIFQVRPINGFNAQLAAAGSLLVATFLGAPVSTSHVVIGSVMGTGAAVRFKAVNWQVAKGILAAWVVTVPASALVSAGVAGLFRLAWTILAC
ncbi:MAG: inorganic phosphate transporter [Clostridia bacterium]|nr:inorganic phosphate transporter [Clostridia bacterium]